MSRMITLAIGFTVTLSGNRMDMFWAIIAADLPP
jgi:hypothetical protein